MSKGIFFVINICNHKGTHLQKSATDTVRTFNMIHDFNCSRKNQTKIAAYMTCNKAMITLFDESKEKLRILLGQWRLENKKYITSWKCFLSRNLHTLYYKEHRTWYKYTQPSNRAHRSIELQTDTKSKY